MKRYLIKEDSLPPNLPVHFSSRILKIINEISVYNLNNIEAISLWSDYLDNLKRYMSKSVIAWDNMNRYPKLRSGGRFVEDCGYDVGYTIINDFRTGLPFVYIFMVNLKPEYFGLEIPPKLNLKENRQHYKPTKKIYRLNESQFRRIVMEVIQELLSA